MVRSFFIEAMPGGPSSVERQTLAPPFNDFQGSLPCFSHAHQVMTRPEDMEARLVSVLKCRIRQAAFSGGDRVFVIDEGILGRKRE